MQQEQESYKQTKDTNDGGSAFPQAPIGKNFILERLGGSAGMTLRAYFAGQALQGICASNPKNKRTNDCLAREAVQLADELIAELNK